MVVVVVVVVVVVRVEEWTLGQSGGDGRTGWWREGLNRDGDMHNQVFHTKSYEISYFSD
jgi:hypothetical protein